MIEIPKVDLPYPCTTSCPQSGKEHYHGNTHMMEPIYMPAEFWDSLAEARAEWKRLADAGTPYWCIHKGRAVDHPAAYWKNDGYFRTDGLEMQYKHGVMCGECGGYIQEG